MSIDFLLRGALADPSVHLLPVSEREDRRTFPDLICEHSASSNSATLLCSLKFRNVFIDD